ncbi:MAG: hypothetical protein IJN68_00095 [Clostridia bacterium]|nr:hypothetical protein [Clostridia bacterium]
MTLEHLYEQYMLSIEKQKVLIDEYRHRLRDAQRVGRQGDVASLNKHLNLLYEEKYELEGRAAEMKGYFRKSASNPDSPCVSC